MVLGENDQFSAATSIVRAAVTGAADDDGTAAGVLLEPSEESEVASPGTALLQAAREATTGKRAVSNAILRIGVEERNADTA